MPRVNPEILSWARETAGLSRGEAVEKLGINDARGVAAVDRLAAIESGAAEPSRPLLLKMARHYRRPLVTFYAHLSLFI
jgi:transcriptional regulator with XRE-family HTH domain